MYLAFALLVVVSGCSKKSGFAKTDTPEAKQLIEELETAFNELDKSLELVSNAPSSIDLKEVQGINRKISTLMTVEFTALVKDGKVSKQQLDHVTKLNERLGKRLAQSGLNPAKR